MSDAGQDVGQAVARRRDVDRRGGGRAVGVLTSKGSTLGAGAAVGADLHPVDHPGRGVTGDVDDLEVLGAAVGVVGAVEDVDDHAPAVVGPAEGVVDDRRVVEVLGGRQRHRRPGLVDAVGDPVDEHRRRRVRGVGRRHGDQVGLRVEAGAVGSVEQLDLDRVAGGDEVVGERVERRRASRLDGEPVLDRQRRLGLTGRDDGDPDRAGGEGALGVDDGVGELVGADGARVGLVLQEVAADGHDPAQPRARR